MNLPLSRKQIRAIAGSTARVNILTGSIRSGKTIASLFAWLMFVADAPLGGQLVVIGRTRDSVARNVFAPLMDASLFGPLAAQVHYTTGAPSATILGRTVYVLGASDAKAEKVLRGLTVAGAYVDEVTVIAEDLFIGLLGRMSVTGARLFCTTNPDNPAHWLKRRFLDRLGELPDWAHWHFVLADNPSLTAEYIASITREYTGLWYRRYILGEWCAAEGAVYDGWDPDRHVVAWDKLPAMTRMLGVGVDYGTTNPSTGLLLGLGVDHRLYLVDEWRVDPATSHARLDDGQLSTSFRAWLGRQHLPYLSAMQPEWIAVDPAAASFRVQLHHDGVHGLVNADNDVLYGIRTVAMLLGRGRLLVSDRCQGLIGEIPGYSWDPAATLKGEDKPIKVADHGADACRYICATTESLWRPALEHPLDLAA